MISKLTINGTDYFLNIKELEDNVQPNIIEKSVIPDPTNLDNDNSILFNSSMDRRKINISGFCTDEDKLIFRNAYRNGLKISPELYNPLGSNNITPFSYYYITKFNTTYKIGDSNVYFDMELTFCKKYN